MGRIKAYYHDGLTKLDSMPQPEQGDYADEPMTEAQLEEMLDYLYEEYMMKHEAYAYEDNPNPNSGASITAKPNNVRCVDG